MRARNTWRRCAAIHDAKLATVAALALALGLLGCAAPQPSEPRLDHNTLDDDAFLGYLADEPLVTVDEAYRAAIILAEGEDPHMSFDERRAWLQERDIARPAWKLEPDAYIDNGSVSFMVCQILKIQGGISRWIFGSWGPGDRRYAYRELVYRDLIVTPSVDYAPMTGGELVNLLGLADEYMAEKGIYAAEPVELQLPQ
ncbi:MAG: hypothetical protein JSU68_08630 [Phycisphaerales bacterium]|nr:MAG: hypothetical protein JSU68_08630 [Phycisphaerales bacterium]